jgi:hypothetical protein
MLLKKNFRTKFKFLERVSTEPREESRLCNQITRSLENFKIMSGSYSGLGLSIYVKKRILKSRWTVPLRNYGKCKKWQQP